MITSTVSELSFASFLGLRNGISAPAFFAIVAIFLSSVLTTTLVTYLLFFAQLIEYSKSGLLNKFLMFFLGIDFEPPNNTTVIIKGIDNQLVGDVAANIRKLRKPEPYKGKGVKYKDEHIRRKAGKRVGGAA